MISRIIPVLALCAAVPAIVTGGERHLSAGGDRAMTAEDGRVFAEVSMPGGSRLEGDGEVIRLTQDCGAEIAGRGAGRWFWTADGTTVRVGSYAVRLVGVPLLPLVPCVG